MSKNKINRAEAEAESAIPEVESVSFYTDVEPWPTKVNGSVLMENLVAAVRRHIVVIDAASVAIALWILFSHSWEAFRRLPLLIVMSPTRGCGKTTLLSSLCWCVRRAMIASNMSAAVVFRAVDEGQPTLLLDEADTFLNKQREMRGILNSGHDPQTAFVYRVEQGRNRQYKTASPKVIASIGQLDDTIMHRGIVIEMKRKSATDTVVELSSDSESEFRKLGQMAARWATDHLGLLRTKSPTMPGGLHNRAADNWRPLLAIAEIIGGRWPAIARQSATSMSEFTETGDDALGELLLADLKPIITKSAHEKVIPSATLVAKLVEMEHRPWPVLMRGGPLTAPKLAHILRPFSITPTLVRVGKGVVRGYKPADFTDPFSRYTP
jgi:putative DNA primase/helicase